MQDWEKKFWQQRQQQVAATKASQQQQGNQSCVDITDKLQGRLQAAMVSSRQGSGGTTANLVEGMPYYTKINSQNFGHTATLFKSAGIISGPTSKNVTAKKEVSGIVVDGLSVVDLGKLQENPLPNITLIEVSVPFVGVFFVQREAVVQAGSGGTGRGLLKG